MLVMRATVLQTSFCTETAVAISPAQVHNSFVLHDENLIRSGYTTCVAPAIETVPATPTSDRTCVDTGGCESFPCSVFAAGCVSSLNSESSHQRDCLGCNAGFVGDGETCTNSIVYAIDDSGCFCDFDDGWYRTTCGSQDSRLCDNMASGAVTRACNVDGVWQEPVSSCAGVYASALQFIDFN